MAFKNLIKREPTIFLFGKLWQFADGQKLSIVFYLALFVFSNLVSLISPLIFAEILNEIQNNGIDASNINYLLLVVSSLLGATLLFWVFHGVARVIEKKVSFYIRLAYREYLLDGVLNLKLSWHGSRDSGDTIDKINRASNALFRFSSKIFLSIEIVIKVVGTAVVLYFFNPYIAFFMFPFIIASLYILFEFDKRLVKLYRKLNLLDNKISAKIYDSISNVTSVVILNVQESIMNNIKKVLLYPRETYMKNVKLIEVKWFVGSVMFDILVVVPLAFYVLFIFKNNLAVEVGTISALYLYLTRLSDVFYTFGDHYEELIFQKTAVQNAQPIEDSFEFGCTKKAAVPTWSEISIKNTDFRYEDTEHHIKHLEEVSLDLQKGEKIALIGESGSGKTTFLKVLHGLYDTAKAKISFDGKTEQDTSFMDINLHTMLVPQEPELFSSSIKENVTFGVDYSDEEIQKVLELAQFNDVVEGLPRGLESVVNERGVNLSGGQKQRLALARALLFVRNKDIILLDESTSSVDPTNETKIYENIFNEFKGKTVIASIHKMNLLKYFDRIVIFDSGKIVDQGTFDELLKKNKEFKSNWDDFIKSND